MENFIVSARKYRPGIFNTVIGQQSITVTLKNSIKNNHLAHAYLFCGPRGVGKTTCARIFAKTINCKNITDKIEACNECESCTSFNNSSSFNIHELDAASNNTVDGIRTLIDQVRIPPQVGKYSIYIIDEVHMLSSQAFNAFLKTLEEPPAHAIFILATTEKHKIIPTILSRCQIFDFNRIKIDDIVEHLKFVAQSESIEADPDGLMIIAQKADGALRDALSIFDQIVSFSGNKFTYQDVIDNLNVLDYDYYFQLVDTFLSCDISKSLMTFNSILDKGFDAHNFINGLSKHFRDVLVCKDVETVKLLEVGDAIKDKYKVQAIKCSINFLYKGLDILSNADINYKTSNNKRLHTELTLVKLCNILETNNKENTIVKPKEETIIKPKEDTSITKQEVPEQKIEDKPKPVEKPVQKQYVPSTPSIKNVISDDKAEENIVEDKDNNVLDHVQEEKEEAFTIEQLTEKWNKYAGKFENEEKRKFRILNSAKLVLNSDFTVEFTAANQIQKETFETDIHSEIIVYLRKELQNNKITLNVTTEELTEDKKIIYSDNEKYNHLAKKNPKLNDMKNMFKLDFQ